MATGTPLKIGEPVLRWTARAHTIAEIEQQLARIWATPDLTTQIEVRRAGTSPRGPA
jgi:hypothetical protein